MKYFTYIIRFIVALTFIFSGFVKLVDPVGSQIKMKEYLAVEVLNMPYLIPYALILSILLILAELVLGVMLLIGFKPKLTLMGLTLLMLVFLFLTWYSAYYNKVTDCGCFGEAVKLGTWETFYKNIFLSACIVYLWIRIKDIVSFLGTTLTNWLPFLTFIGGLYISYYVLQHLPIIDFTAYKVGTNIPENMKFKEGVDIPPIHDFIFENETEDMTEQILSSEKVLLIIAVSLSESNLDNFKEIKNTTDQAIQKGYRVFALSSSNMEDFQFIKEKFDLNFEMLWGDSTTLKTMIRANPGIMILNNGTIMGKWNANDTHSVKL